MTKVITVTIEPYDWYCGDGCCSEHGYDISLEMDGKEITSYRHYDYDTVLAEEVAQALGCELKYEYKYDND